MIEEVEAESARRAYDVRRYLGSNLAIGITERDYRESLEESFASLVPARTRTRPPRARDRDFLLPFPPSPKNPPRRARARPPPAAMPVPFVTVDVFTTRKFRGNPAAVVLLSSSAPQPPEARPDDPPGTFHWPPASYLANVAREFALSETAFVLPTRVPVDDEDKPRDDKSGEPEAFSIRWFTRDGSEVDLCGHGTLAAAHALWDTHLVSRTRVVVFRTQRAGDLRVVPVGGWQGLGEGLAEISLPLSAPTLERLGADAEKCDAAAVTSALGLPLDGTTRVKVIGRNEIGDTFALLEDQKTLRAATPRSDAIAALGGRGLVITCAATEKLNDEVDADFESRFFGPNIGIDEDPVTGSAFCGLAPYWFEALRELVDEKTAAAERTRAAKEAAGASGGVGDEGKDFPDGSCGVGCKRVDHSAPVERAVELIGYQASRRGGFAKVSVDGDRVRVKGCATTVMTGHIFDLKSITEAP